MTTTPLPDTNSTASTAESTEETTTAGRRRRLPRLLVAAMCLLTLTGGTLLGDLATATPSDAMIIGGTGGTYVGNTTYGETGCIRNRLSITPYASVQPGYAQQWVTARYHVSSSGGQVTSNFSTPMLLSNRNYVPTPLWTAYRTASMNTNWNVWVEVLRWNGYQWLSSGWVRSGYTSYTGTPVTNCYT